MKIVEEEKLYNDEKTIRSSAKVGNIGFDLIAWKANSGKYISDIIQDAIKNIKCEKCKSNNLKQENTYIDIEEPIGQIKCLTDYIKCVDKARIGISTKEEVSNLLKVRIFWDVLTICETCNEKKILRHGINASDF